MDNTNTDSVMLHIARGYRKATTIYPMGVLVIKDHQSGFHLWSSKLLGCSNKTHKAVLYNGDVVVTEQDCPNHKTTISPEEMYIAEIKRVEVAECGFTFYGGALLGKFNKSYTSLLPLEDLQRVVHGEKPERRTNDYYTRVAPKHIGEILYVVETLFTHPKEKYFITEAGTIVEHETKQWLR
jgi:hypothetical protein